MRILRKYGHDFDIAKFYSDNPGTVENFTIAGIPVDGVSENSHLLDFKINFSCYYAPTVIKSPITESAQTEFTYTIGEPDLVIKMVSDDGN